VDITPLIPDEYEGSVKRLTCRLCEHVFYVAKTYFDSNQGVMYCHECSIAIDKNQKAQEKAQHDEEMKARREKKRAEVRAMIAQWDEEEKDTPEKAMIRSIVEKPKEGFKLLYYYVVDERDGLKSWRTVLTKIISEDVRKNTRVTEYRYIGIAEMPNPDPDVPFYLIIPYRPSQRVTSEIIDAEEREWLQKMEEKRRKEGRIDLPPFI